MGREGNQYSIILHCEHNACSEDPVMVVKSKHAISIAYLSSMQSAAPLPGWSLASQDAFRSVRWLHTVAFSIFFMD